MPLYEYECEACGERFELIRRFSDPPVTECALCGKGPVQRLVSSPAIQFKGSGWYITDYAQKGKTEKPSADKTAAAPADTSSGKDATKQAESGSSTPAAPAKTAAARED